MKPAAEQTGDANGALQRFATSIAEGVRDADLVATADGSTLVLLPTEDTPTDVNALVGRVRAQVDSVRAADPYFARHEAPTITTCWLDPAADRPTTELLADAIAPTATSGGQLET